MVLIMGKKEYSAELSKMLSELEDPDVKQPTLRRFAVLDEEERTIYMKAVEDKPEQKKVVENIPPIGIIKP